MYNEEQTAVKLWRGTRRKKGGGFQGNLHQTI